MFIAFLGLMIGITLFIFGISAFIQFKYLNFASNYWGKKRLKNGNSLSSLRKKITGTFYILVALLILLTSLGTYLSHLDNQKKEGLITNEAKRLGMSVEEYRRIDSAFLFMPKNSTISDYAKLDEVAKKLGFKDGYDYLISEYRANKEGRTIEDVITDRKVKQEKDAAEMAVKKAKQEKDAAEMAVKARREDEKVRDSNAINSIPQGEFYTDRGQVSLEVYRAACKKAFASKRYIVTELSVAWSGSPEGKLASNLGESSISNTQIWWDENSQMCYGSYVVSGLANGNNYSLRFSGRVQGFYNSGGGTISGNIGRR
jgi:hypothetical protein